MRTKSIRQSVTFRAPPGKVYEAIMDSRKHARLTGSKATISRKVRGAFAAYDGYIKGTNLELVPEKRIVQSWHASEDCWPEGHFSKVTLSFKRTRTGTKMSFFHSGVPEGCYKSLKQGW